MRIHVMFDPESVSDIEVSFDGLDSAQEMPVPIAEAVEPSSAPREQ